MNRTFKTFGHVMLVFVLFSFSTNAFAKKRELKYIDLSPTIKANSSLNICVATFDQREVVLKGNQDARFVGYIRSSVAIAYPIRNTSEMDFSEVMSTTVANALQTNGNTTSVLKTDYNSSKETVKDELISQESDVYVLITMNKWRTDTKAMNALKMATELIYDITVEVYNKEGELLASHRLNKEEPGLSPSGAVSMKKIQANVVNPKYPEVMTNLFSNADIEKALQ